MDLPHTVTITPTGVALPDGNRNTPGLRHLRITMPTQEERRNAFLEFHASDCWESRRRELVAIIFPDDPPPKQTTFNIHQQFAEGTDPDRVAQIFKESVEQVKRTYERPEWVQQQVMQSIKIEFIKQMCAWLRGRGKKKIARYINHNYPIVSVPAVVPDHNPPEDQHR